MAEQSNVNTTLELFNGNNMTEIESSKKIGKELQEALKKEYDEMVYIIKSAIFPKVAFLNVIDCQKVVNVDVNNVDELTWWLDISAMSFIEYNKNSNTNVFTPKLKRMLLEYCLKTSINEYINDIPCGKIPLFDGFAYLDVFYLKEVMPNIDKVINGERDFCDICQYFENNKSVPLMQHEAYPFIEIPTPEPLLLLDDSMYEKFYKKVFAGKDEYSDSLKSCNIANRLKLIHKSIVKVETTSPIQSKWKSLLLTYIPENIKIELERGMVTKTVEETIDKIEETDTEEDKKSNDLSVLERIMYFYYTTGYWGNDLKKHSVVFGKLNSSSVESKFKTLAKFERMSKKELEPYKASLEKIKNLLSNNSSDVMSAVIDKIERDIKKCEQRK